MRAPGWLHRAAACWVLGRGPALQGLSEVSLAHFHSPLCLPKGQEAAGRSDETESGLQLEQRAPAGRSLGKPFSPTSITTSEYIF